MSVNPFEFQQARVKQVLFKSRLRSVLYGVRAPEPGLCALAHNPLHQWVETYLKPALGSAPQVSQLEQALRRMLSRGQALLDQHQRGQIEQARTGLAGIEADAGEIDRLLAALEQR